MDVGTVEATLKLRDAMTPQVEKARDEFGRFVKGVGSGAGTVGADINGMTSRAGESLQTFSGHLKTALSTMAGFMAAQVSMQALTSSIESTVAASGTFEQSMVRLTSLAGVQSAELATVKQHILDLAPAVGIGPQALADAMMVVSSTVSDTSVALSILDMAAKASAAGLGEAKDVGKALTAIINSYGSANITAAQAADILTKAVQDGGAEAKELAPTLANVVPMAAQLGISFAEVAANIATFTKLGVPASEAVTSLSAVMSALLNPTREQEKALGLVNLTLGQLRAQITEKGLAAAMVDLSMKFGENKEALAQVFGRVEALRNVMGTAGQQAATYRDEMGRMRDAAGALDGAFQAIEKTSAQTWNEAKAQLSVFALAIGDALAPALSAVVGWLKDGVLPATREWLEYAHIGALRVAGAFYTLAKAQADIASAMTFGMTSEVFGEVSRKAQQNIEAIQVEIAKLTTKQLSDEFIKTAIAARTANDALGIIAGDGLPRVEEAGKKIPPAVGGAAKASEALAKALEDIRRAGIPLTAQQQAQVLEWQKLGVSAGTMAAALGISDDAIQKFLSSQREAQQESARLNKEIAQIEQGHRGVTPEILATARAFGDEAKATADLYAWMVRMDIGQARWAIGADEVQRKAMDNARAFEEMRRAAMLLPDAVPSGTIDRLRAIESDSDKATASVGEMASAFNVLSRALRLSTNEAAQTFATILDGIGGVLSAASRGDIVGAISEGVDTLISLFGKEGQMRVNDMRDAYIEAAGGLHALNVQASAAGTSLSALLSAKSASEYQAAIKDLEKRIGAYNDRLREQKQLEEDIKQLEEDILAIKTDITRTEGEIAALQAKLVPTWNDVKSAMERYGISLDGIGQKVQQLALTDVAKSLLNDWELLSRAGADTTAILKGMSPQLSTMVQNALKFGVELPANMKPVIESLMAQGLLLDGNGTKITDLSKLKFGDPVKTEADIIKEAMGALKDKLGEMVDKLGELVAKFNGLVSPAQEAARQVGAAFAKAPWEDWQDPVWPNPPNTPPVDGVGSFASGTGGRFLDFGRGTLAVLHGRERVMTEREASTGPGTTQHITVQVGEDVICRAVARGLPRTLRVQGY